MYSAVFEAENEPISIELPAPVSTPEKESERRVNPRQVLRVQARITADGDEPLDARTIDLSSHGLAVTSSRPLNVDQECTVELCISVPELAQPPSLRASVRYCARLGDDQFRIGMKFTALSIEAAELLVATLGI